MRAGSLADATVITKTIGASGRHSAVADGQFAMKPKHWRVQAARTGVLTKIMDIQRFAKGAAALVWAPMWR
jgi:hypothetical protein